MSPRWRRALPYLTLPAMMLLTLPLMEASTWTTLTLAGLAMGMIIFMMAAGLGLIFGLMDVLNFAHGAFITFGAYVAASVLAALHASAPGTGWGASLGALALALLAASLVGAVLGYACERIIIAPVYGAHLKQILVTVGVLIVAEQLVPVLWGPVPVAVPRPPVLQGALVLGEVAVEKYRLLAVVLGLAMFGLLQLVLERTRIGLLIRAGVQNREMVQALGYRIQALFVAVFVAGSALASFGGVMWALYHGLITPTLGGEVLILVFIVIIIGGPGSISGTFLAALLVGLLANYVGYLAPKLALGCDILLMVAVLLWRPSGLVPAGEA